MTERLRSGAAKLLFLTGCVAVACGAGGYLTGLGLTVHATASGRSAVAATTLIDSSLVAALAGLVLIVVAAFLYPLAQSTSRRASG